MIPPVVAVLLKIPSTRYRSLADAARADVGRSIAMAAGGALAFAPIEYALTLWAAGPTDVAIKLRLLALVATLSLYLFFMLAVALAAVIVATRLVRRCAVTGEPAWVRIAFTSRPTNSPLLP